MLPKAEGLGRHRRKFVTKASSKLYRERCVLSDIVIWKLGACIIKNLLSRCTAMSHRNGILRYNKMGSSQEPVIPYLRRALYMLMASLDDPAIFLAGKRGAAVQRF